MGRRLQTGWITLLLGWSWAVGIWSVLPSTVAVAAPAVDPKIVHVVNRLSLGPRPGDLERVRSLGIERYLQDQLASQQSPQPAALTQRLQKLETLKLTSVQIMQTYRARQRQRRSLSFAEKRVARQQRQQLLQEATKARLLRAIASPRQLEEVMVNFWFNHFNISALSAQARLYVGTYEREAIRPYVLGSFRDLLGATAHHPAMLLYLDNWLNTAPGSPGAQGRFQGLNENYARELLELHTLGVEGGYTQADVVATAKIFTGWGLPPERQPQLGDRNGFYFNPRRHDFSDKVLLGTKIPGQGLAEGEQVLDLLARHPATAHHISYKLAQYFVADDPPSQLVKRLAQGFQATDGNLKAVLEMLFQSPEFWDSRYMGTKFKTPYEYILSLARATGDESIDLRLLAGALNQLSMPLYRCRTPNGYAHTQDSWLNSDAITRRVSLATSLAYQAGRSGAKFNADQLDRTLGSPFSAQTLAVIQESPPQLRAALMLGSPELMYR